MGIKVRIACVIFFSLIVSAHAGEQKQLIEEVDRKAVDAAASHSSRSSSILTEYGGWVNYRYNHFRDDDNDRSSKDSLSSSSFLDGRAWFKFTRQTKNSKHEHALYVRFKDRYIQRDGEAPGARYDMDGPHLDYAYGILDYRPVWVEAGRRYFNVGRGIVYSDINDGIQINFRKPGFNAGLFVAKSFPHDSNIDSSVPGYDKQSERYFYGLGVGYTGIPRQSLYGFLLVQQDQSNERPIDSDQNYTYNSQYAGIGAKGDFFTSWSYWGELIAQTGSSRIFGTNERKDVGAFAVDVELAYSPKITARPRFSFEYAMGSGDKDRESVTDTEFGNISGSDRNFLYFGYAPTGFALAPRLSNLQMLRAGFEARPFERFKALRYLTMGVDFYRFFKDRSSGGISDLEATEDSSDIGNEVDLFLKWRVLSDVTVSLEYGHFLPGKAYAAPVDASQDFFSVGVTHTF